MKPIEISIVIDCPKKLNNICWAVALSMIHSLKMAIEYLGPKVNCSITAKRDKGTIKS